MNIPFFCVCINITFILTHGIIINSILFWSIHVEMYTCILRDLQSNLFHVRVTYFQWVWVCSQQYNTIQKDRFINTLSYFISFFFFFLHRNRHVLYKATVSTLEDPIYCILLSAVCRPPSGWQPHSSVEWYVLWHGTRSLWTWLGG